ncbi:glutathione S-transferase [Methyloceanibacter methanicus]|uniref:Glutathione S-transferase n=2 Tax=Methyloceanibacter methanicus TaxID=1774968 RepID=A0A1E3W3A9_9HYPH|nr:glutathione S-transferase [Methyloceanibacter methanicus]
MTGTGYRLVIGDKNYSSWSLRPWLSLKACGAPFEEERIRLRLPETKAEIFKHSPSGKVPALKTDFGVIYDSLAIVEYLAEQFPDAGLWPEDTAARAAARSISAEMHSSFQALRNDMPMDLVSRFPMPEVSETLALNIQRVVAVWKDTRARFGQGGPLLFGAFTNADAMYAPVATRFRTYGVPLAAFGDDGTAAAYVEAIYAMPDMAAWLAGAEAEMAERALV